ncbi:MAG TPA: DNA polymerase, partial [Miltoncostaeaceae bacterium]|nr:DNA polymerase [Miltoncostaeaceae bacterium]
DAVSALDFGPERMAALREMFALLQFDTLSRRLGDLADEGADAPSAAPVTHRFTLIESAPQDLALRLAGSMRPALGLAGGRWAVAGDGDEVLGGDLAGGDGPALVAALAGLPVICHDAKTVVRALGAPLNVTHDTLIAAYLLAPRRRDYPLLELAGEAGIHVADGDEAARLALCARELAGVQEPALADAGLEGLYREIELPVTGVLAAMEDAGLLLDRERLAQIAARVRAEAATLRGEIWELAGGEFTIESPKQLGQVLFERLGLPTFRKGKTGWSTDRKVLAALHDK